MRILFSFITACLLLSCFEKKGNDVSTSAAVPANNTIDKMNMIQADKDFSRLCEEKGYRVAFIEYLDSSGVLLKPNEPPLINAEAINYISEINDSAYTMSWEPQGAAIAKSGELGYTYGVYLIKFKQKDSVLKGTYVNIWKKQADGTWKYDLQSGNDGLGVP